MAHGRDRDSVSQGDVFEGKGVEKMWHSDRLWWLVAGRNRSVAQRDVWSLSAVFGRLARCIESEFREPSVQVGGPGHFEFEFFVGDRVSEGKGGRVECLAGRPAVVLDERAVGFFRVDRIAAEQVAGFGQVDTDLVGSSCFELAFDQAVGTDGFEGPNVGDGLLFGGVRGLDFGGFGASVAIAAVADESGVEGLLLGMAVDDRVVFANDFVVFEGFDEALSDAWRASKEHQAAGIAV